MINTVSLTGRLTKEPELRFTPSGVGVATMTIAVNRNFKNSQGEIEADFVRLIAFKERASLMADTLKKGALIGIEGRIQTGHYDDDQGKRVWTTDIIVNNFAYLETKQEEEKPQKKQYNRR